MTAAVNHRVALIELAQFGKPIADLRREILGFSHDFDGIPVLLTKKHIAHALELFIERKITAGDLESWAGLIEGSSGIEYEESIAERLNNVIFRLATPKINDPITSELCWRLLKEMHDW
jgi:hypothetical protein